MTALLTIIVLVFILVAIWQMVKIFDLAQAKGENSAVATDKDNTMNAYLMMGFLASFISLPLYVLLNGEICH
ncbi:cytochrome c oxidase polypeptide II [Algibacter lectus]|uniref:Cytochrome c oxidase polypeptide II n=1 Tax=Algibacter lectus TaxID=221126 RepID=A0A090WW33_9FLAO|nr:cytochrome c oxidase polypeptide II [Algibacter lectus]